MEEGIAMRRSLPRPRRSDNAEEHGVSPPCAHDDAAHGDSRGDEPTGQKAAGSLPTRMY